LHPNISGEVLAAAIMIAIVIMAKETKEGEVEL
jgi:hypothetical protein